MNVRVELSIWTAAALLLAGALIVWRRPVGVPDAAATRGANVMPLARDAGQFARLAGGIIASDPFRLDREPNPLRYDPDNPHVMQSGAAAPPPQRPTLLLRAIVGGPPWEALLEGIPGRSGPSLVRPGDTLGDLVIRSVFRDTVVVAGLDTTWRLGIGRGWQ